jgi:hypothetical protein
MHKEITSTLNSGNAHYHLAQNLSRNIKIKIYKIITLLHPGDGGSKVLHITGIILHHYTVPEL